MFAYRRHFAIEGIGLVRMTSKKLPRYAEQATPRLPVRRTLYRNRYLMNS